MKLFLAKLGDRIIELFWVAGFIYCDFLKMIDRLKNRWKN